MHCNLKWLQLQYLKNIPLKPPVGLLPVTENPTAIECLLEAAAALTDVKHDRKLKDLPAWKKT